MRVPVGWLRDYVEIELQPEALAEKLTLLGMEVQGIERRGDDWRSVVVGELLDVSEHPGADRLRLTRVRVGNGRRDLSIVCGATNIAVGQRVPVALPGAVLPGERAIGISRIAGAESEGMLCSGAELRLTDDAEGILILPTESPVGRPLAELYGEVVLDIDVKPNRGDALSLIGLAREVSAATGAPLRWPEIEPPEHGDATTQRVHVDVRDAALCPRFVARYLDQVTVAPSPLEVQLRLTAAGIRPVSNVVDATNYVMVEMGKPTHAFDATRVADGRLVVRLARAGERLETLDHVERELDGDTLVIADGHGPLAIAGVMGGASSEVGEGTSAVILESAIFDPVNIRRTGQRYGLRSEASMRFEKGQEWRLARVGADRVARLVAVWAGARVAVGVVDTDAREPVPVRVAFRPARVARLLGVPISAAEAGELLARVGVVTEPASRGDRLAVPTWEEPLAEDGRSSEATLVAIVPTHRRDLTIEADLAEEIARVRGYETVPAQSPDTPMPPYRDDPHRLPDQVRDLLSARGLSEVVCHAIVGPGDHLRLGLAPDDPSTIRVANPVSVDHSELRRSMLPGLVGVLAHNERQRRFEVAVFEVGRTHRFEGGQPVETNELALLVAGDWQPRGWDQEGRAADLGDVKGLLEWLAKRLDVRGVRYEPAAAVGGVEHPGRTARVVVDAQAQRAGPPAGMQGAVELGRVTELDPRYLAQAGVRAERVAFASLHLDVLERLVPERVAVVPVARVPLVERDLAVVVDAARPAADVESVVRATAGELLRDVRLFDRYEGPPLAEGEVSLAYRLRLQAPEHTLTDEEVDEVVARIEATLRDRLGARLRR
ncbi:MAG: phenylalanine--tRNA ligase subunit beta [Chloroflexota bacterium]|nr:phenylalanine--tRNA ligase subunit beta [Chloroflexota bacterium]